MTIQLHRMPKVGDYVKCPADRGDPAFYGTITHVTEKVETNIHGVKYVWCVVKAASHGCNGGVWPSHRLGYRLPQLEV